MNYCKCTVCGEFCVVDFPTAADIRWHGFPQSQGHYFIPDGTWYTFDEMMEEKENE